MFKIGSPGINSKRVVSEKTEADLVTDERIRILRERLLEAKKQNDKHLKDKTTPSELPS